MPTALPRFQVTETPEVARALQLAEQAWPELPRAERVKRLLELGAEAAANDDEERVSLRREAIRETSGMFTGYYETDHLQKLRDEWPE